ncbi:MAG: undecaprenyl/decaprenyl-phosphate alpha-N-acetylglucosaminyl 1-phosphate transferase [Anaerolineae bacterium]|nr:undecaprenyl/decaprenyl-phosphate alpha-N-acetylglucosaminyl 1-phosphate transferase [Anaerolineae bacterium]
MMSEFIPLILASGFVSFLATPVIRQIAHSTGFVSVPVARSVHVTPMPMLGGVAIYVGLVAALLISGFQPWKELLGVSIGMTIVVIVGLLDDRYGTPPIVRLLAELLAAAVLIISGIQVQLLPWPVANYVLTALWVIGICNALNFQDNMDGLAAGLAAIASGAFFVLAVIEGLGLVATLAAATMGACVAFLYYNFNPATLFMGDTGALLLGFILAVLGIKLEFAGRPTDSTWLIPIVLLGVPIFDAMLVILSRIRRKRPIYVGGRDHTSHRMVSLFGMTHARAVMTLYLSSVALGLTGLMLRDSTPAQARTILVIFLAIFTGTLIWLEWRFATFSPIESEPPAH